MTRVLVAGFEPFGRWQTNPSGILATQLPQILRDKVSITGVVLPVSWRLAMPTLRNAVLSYQPSVIIVFGVARTVDVRMEIIAKNTAAPQPDNSGELPETDELYRFAAESPAALFTTLPVTALIPKQLNPQTANHWTTTQLEAKPSFDAGAYLCNFVFYHTMLEFHDAPFRGFIHVPPYIADDPEVGTGPETLTGIVAELVQKTVQVFESAPNYTQV